jgi:hypothetical protein
MLNTFNIFILLSILTQHHLVSISVWKTMIIIQMTIISNNYRIGINYISKSKNFHLNKCRTEPKKIIQY